jgi:hypothetical protein
VMLPAIACASFAVDNPTRADIIPVSSEERLTASPGTGLVLINGTVVYGD